jgi:transcriptional regulator with XRE-family HTH domain
MMYEGGDHMEPSELGARVKEVREMRNLSLRQAADAAGISSAYLHKIERGEVKAPSPHMLHALSEALNVPYSTLMQLAGYIVPAGSGDEDRPNLLAHALSSEELTDDEASALANYLSWYRHENSGR